VLPQEQRRLTLSAGESPYPDYPISCRDLSWGEVVAFYKLMASGKAYEAEDIVLSAIVDPPTFREVESQLLPEFVIRDICRRILCFTSGTKEPEPPDLTKLIEKGREEVKANPEDQILIVLSKAFPALSLEQLRAIPFSEFGRMVAMAESISGAMLESEEDRKKKEREALVRGKHPRPGRPGPFIQPEQGSNKRWEGETPLNPPVINKEAEAAELDQFLRGP